MSVFVKLAVWIGSLAVSALLPATFSYCFDLLAAYVPGVIRYRKLSYTQAWSLRHKLMFWPVAHLKDDSEDESSLKKLP